MRDLEEKKKRTPETDAQSIVLIFIIRKKALVIWQKKDANLEQI
jgi:hypothetical protein